MSTNLQWRSFQQSSSSSSTTTPEILNVQHAPTQTKTTLRNGNEQQYLNTVKEYSNVNNGGRPPAGSFGGSGDCSNVDNFHDSQLTSSSSSSGNHHQYDPPVHPNRETGIIEKLLHSYGFIQCCERQARLFFHFSQFSGNIEHLKIGDPVEFEMTYDRRTGKPIASTVTKIAPEVVLSEARVTGTVTTELRNDGLGDTTGRISYENRGECFFLPYTKDDVEGNVTLSSGDSVSFQIATNQRGNLGACHIRLENPVHPVKYQGVVCSMKESFGFIERADVVKEIFFHFSEAKTKNNLNLGDDVEFIIQTRYGKEVACNITRLAPGSVVFEDVCPEITKGQVLKPIERGNTVKHQNDPLPGRIRYRALDHSEVDVPFGDKDQNGEFTLRHGDWVQFQVAIDRRDQLKRATNISLLDESFNVSGEKRERGIVSILKDGFGFIECVQRESLFFHFTEVLVLGQTLTVGDEVEFTVDPAATFSNSRPSAIRIKHLPPGSVQFESVLEKGIQGVIGKEANLPSSNFQSQEISGLINYQSNGTRKSIIFYGKDVNGKTLPREGDKVIFNICQIKRTKEMIAMSIVLQSNSDGFICNGTRSMLQGFIAALKDGYGFIETVEHDREVFFHFSNFQGNIDTLEVGKEVEYSIGKQSSSSSGGCISAELVRKLPKGSIPVPQPTDKIHDGLVTRSIRALNPEQLNYTGLIETSTGSRFEYGITGLAYKRELLRIGDSVTFQVDTENWATNIVASRKKRRSTIDYIHGVFGFLSFEIEESKKLIFYTSEIRGPPNSLQTGDSVEFNMCINQRTGKVTACNIYKMSSFDTNDSENGKDTGEFSTQHRQNSYSDVDTFNTSGGHGQRSSSYDFQYQSSGKSFKNYEQSQSFDGVNSGSYEYKRDLGERRSDFYQSDSSRPNGMMRKKRRAVVESIKGPFGYLSVETEDNKKLMFYMTEVRGPPGNVQPGDVVEYNTVTNQRTGKMSAVNISKLSDSVVPTARPERLISRLRTASLDECGGPRLVAIREPRGPDGTRGFRPRVPLKPVSCR